MLSIDCINICVANSTYFDFENGNIRTLRINKRKRRDKRSLCKGKETDIRRRPNNANCCAAALFLPLKAPLKGNRTGADAWEGEKLLRRRLLKDMAAVHKQHLACHLTGKAISWELP